MFFTGRSQQILVKFVGKAEDRRPACCSASSALVARSFADLSSISCNASLTLAVGAGLTRYSRSTSLVDLAQDLAGIDVDTFLHHFLLTGFLARHAHLTLVVRRNSIL
jgi:hypothetical protein